MHLTTLTSLKNVIIEYKIKTPYILGNLWTGKRSIFPNGLESLLKSVPDGQIVLIKKGGLDNQSRQKLVKIIIDHLILQNNPNHRFPSILKHAADEIVELFPEERMECYYIPYTKKSDSMSKGKTRGKLYSKWVNCKRAFTLAKNDKYDGSSRADGPEVAQMAFSEKEKLSYSSLLYATGDSFEQITNDWRSSYNMRMSMKKTFDSSLTYFRTFPALKQSLGYKLLLEDFNTKYPTAKDVSIHNTWPKVATAIVDILRTKQIQAPNLYSSSSGVIKLSLKVFAWLFKPPTLRNKLINKNCKPSRVEMTDRFLLHVQPHEDLEAKIHDRKNKLKEFDVCIQPFMVAVGPMNNIQSIFVVLDDVRYPCTDCLMAVDVTFKIFFALDIPFPAECRAMWQTIDQIVYKIYKCADPAASSVLTELEHKMSKT